MHLKRSQVKLLIIFSLSIVLICSWQAFAQTPQSQTSSPEAASFFNTDFWQKVILAILSATLAFVSGYVLAGINRKRQETEKKLSYSLSIENGLVKIEKDIRERVKVLYDSEEIENLYNVSFDLENTGATVVKSQEIRFAFTEDTRILDFSFEPKPEPEMKVEKIEAGLRSFERKCKIGQIERGQKLSIRFTTTSKSELQEVKLHPYNEVGDVKIESRSISKALRQR
jgi:hypothetical protein